MVNDRDKNLQAALMIYLFLLPLIPGVLGLGIGALPVITPQRILLLGILMVWIARKAIAGKSISSTPLDKLVALLIIAECLTVVVSFNVGASLFRLVGDIIEDFGLYYITVDLIRNNKDIGKVITILLLGSFVAGVFGFAEVLTGINLFRDILFPNAAWDWLPTYAYVLPGDLAFHRIQGPFGHPIEFGHYIAVLFPIAVVSFNNAATRWKSVVQFTNLLLLGSNLVATIARGAMVGFLVSLLLLQSKVRRFLIVALVVLVPVVVLNPLSLDYLGSLGELLSASFSTEGPTTSANVSLVTRLEMLNAAIQTVAERPILGYGLNASRKGLGSNSPFFNRSDLYALENYYLGLLIDGGLVLFVSQMLLYLAILVQLWVGYKRAHTGKEGKDLLLGLIASSLGLFVALLTVNGYLHIISLYWALVALGMRVVINHKHKGVLA